MENVKFAMSFFISNIDSNIKSKKIFILSKFIADYYNLPYTNFSFTVTDNGKSKTKAYKFTEKNLNTLLSIDSKKITAMSFVKHKLEKSYTDTEITFEFLTTTKNDFPSRIEIVIDSSLLNKALYVQDIIKIAQQFELLNLDLIYGVLLHMENKKKPNFFLIGWETTELSEEEKKIADALSLNIRQYKNKIWDIFEHNIIKKQLITSDMLNKIKEVVSEGNIIEIGDKYIISLPVKATEYIENGEKTKAIKSKLRAVFQDKDEIMFK